jgi:3-phenylpropionate/trans-cinnamate dioxygenase ferredoxin component
VTQATTTKERVQLGEKVGVCAASELGPGESRIVEVGERKIGVFNCDGALYAIEDRCSHDDGPLAHGEFDAGACTVECPRHGSLFDLTTGRPKTLPAYVPVETFPVTIEGDTVQLEVD